MRTAQEVAAHLDDMTHTRFAELLDAGWCIKSNVLAETFVGPESLAQHGAGTILLFGIEPNGRPRIVSNRRATEPHPGWTAVALVRQAQVAASA